MALHSSYALILLSVTFVSSVCVKKYRRLLCQPSVSLKKKQQYDQFSYIQVFTDGLKVTPIKVVSA